MIFEPKSYNPEATDDTHGSVLNTDSIVAKRVPLQQGSPVEDKDMFGVCCTEHQQVISGPYVTLRPRDCGLTMICLSGREDLKVS